MNFDEMFKRLFKTTDIKEQLDRVDNNCIGAMFENKTLTYEMLINFIDEYEPEIISSALKDNQLVENLLCDDLVVDTTKKHLITKEYIKNLINKIKNREFDTKSLTLYLYIMEIHNLFGTKFSKETIKEILDLNILSIVNNIRLVSEDGDTIASASEKVELTDKLLSWNEKCGQKILPYIFLLETLKKNIISLMNSNEVMSNIIYQKNLSNILKICEYSILVRDTEVVPTPEEVEQINDVFSNYDIFNKIIIIDTLEKSDTMLVHFVRDNEVNYQLIGNKITDVSDYANNEFDSDQSSFFISSYFEHIVSKIEEQTGRKFDINNLEMRELLKRALEYYNSIINNRPLDRLPIKKRETSDDFKEYIRETDSRLSCSFVSKNNLVSHLNRKIGLVLRPKSIRSILSTSLGYTSEKNFYDFRNDCAPCTEIFKQIEVDGGVNETCVDASECDVIGVLLLSDEKKMVERAEKLAASYNTTVIYLADKKVL